SVRLPKWQATGALLFVRCGRTGQGGVGCSGFRNRFHHRFFEWPARIRERNVRAPWGFLVAFRAHRRRVGGETSHDQRTTESTRHMQQDLWASAVAFTREKSPGSFEQWFSGVQFDGMTDGVVSLRARDEFVKDWVERYFMPTLVDHLQNTSGLSVQIAWTV